MAYFFPARKYYRGQLVEEPAPVVVPEEAWRTVYLATLPLDGQFISWSSALGAWIPTSLPSGGSGDVVGPVSSITDNIAAFSDTTGKLIKDTGIASASLLLSSGSYADPAWITSLAWVKITGAPVSFPPSSHSHAWADITSGVPDFTLKTENTEALQFFRTTTTLTNMAAGLFWLVSDAQANLRNALADLTGRSKIRLMTMVTTAGSASAKVIVRYKAGAFSTNKANYLVIGDLSVELSNAINVGGDTWADSGWIDIVAAARTEVWLGIFTIDGNGVADPVLQQSVVLYK